MSTNVDFNLRRREALAALDNAAFGMVGSRAH